MALFDLPLDALEGYRPEPDRPADFDAFWDRTLAAARRHPLEPVFAPVVTHLETVEVVDVTFSGYGGQRIRGWLLLPRHRDGALPCVVEYLGYGGGRGLPHDWLIWASAGYAHLVMDTRGQGGGWRRGDTPDLPQDDGSSPHTPGFLTLGVLSPESHYYRRLITDAVRAVETAQAFPEIDADRIAVTGVSQGGGLALAVAGLARDEVAVAMPDVPFLCHYRRAVEITDSAPYTEIRQFLKLHRDRVDDVFRTLTYVDGVNFAMDATAAALFSVALMDDVCPPSTVFAAYNRYAGAEKEIRVYPYNRHEGGESEQVLVQVEYLGRRFS